jgi:predicted Fe-Mo cluster-binding NifX family protein
MKVAFSSKGSDMQSGLDPRFGRANGFVILDTDSNTVQYLTNEQGTQSSHGAGIRTAQMLSEQGVQAVITGAVGPKAYRVLQAASIQAYPCTALTLEQALQEYISGALVPTTQE